MRPALMDALLGELFQGISSVALAWYRDRTGTAQKLHRLEMLVIKLRSVVEVSKKTKIKSKSLRDWRQKLENAATQGDEVLRKHREQFNNSSSSTWGIRAFIVRLVSQKEDVEKLNGTIEFLEQISAEVKDFIETLNLELRSELRLMKLKRLAFNRRKTPDYGPKCVIRQGRLLSKSKIEEVDAVGRLVNRLQGAVDQAKQKEEDGSWLGRWIAKLTESANEGKIVASAIERKEYYVRDEIYDEVGVIVTVVRLRLESMVSDLEDLSVLSMAEELASELTAHQSSANEEAVDPLCSRVLLPSTEAMATLPPPNKKMKCFSIHALFNFKKNPSAEAC